MAHSALLDRLNYYPPRRRWRLRFKDETGKWFSKLFGPACKEGDQAGYAAAVLEADTFLAKREEMGLWFLADVAGLLWLVVAIARRSLAAIVTWVVMIVFLIAGTVYAWASVIDFLKVP